MPVCVYTACPTCSLQGQPASWLCTHSLLCCSLLSPILDKHTQDMLSFQSIKATWLSPAAYCQGCLALVPPRSHQLLHSAKLFSWHKSSNMLRLSNPPTCVVFLLASLACSSQVSRHSCGPSAAPAPGLVSTMSECALIQEDSFLQDISTKGAQHASSIQACVHI